MVDKLNDALAKHKKGIDIDPERVTVAEYLARWLEESAKPTIRHDKLAASVHSAISV